MAIIVLDPGHGGTVKVGGSSPNNAQGPTGLLEKTITLDLGKRTRDILLAKGHTVIMTRMTDINLGLAERAGIAKSARAHAFVSIHFNGFNHVAQGTETLVNSVHTPASHSLAQAVQARMLVATRLVDRGVKAQPLGVLKPQSHAANTACCLVEISFMDVAAEEARLKTEAYKDRLAQALAQGILNFLAAGVVESVAVRRPPRAHEDGFSIQAQTMRIAQKADRMLPDPARNSAA